MSTLRLHALHPPAFPVFARVAAFVKLMIEVFAEAQSQARAAHARYPFAEW